MYKYLFMVPLVLAAPYSISAETTASLDAGVEQQERLDNLLAGRQAGRAKSCIIGSDRKNVTVIDDKTAVFRSGPDAETFYVSKTMKNCSGMTGNRLRFKQRKRTTCAGDEAKIISSETNRVKYSRCSFGKFVPYSK